MKLIGLFFILITLISTGSFASQFYRWVDEEGNTYIQSYIPPEFVAGGYEIIDDNGIILKKVAPQISEAERQANEAAQISAEMQQARDEELLKIYRSPTDVDRAMNTWTSRMTMEIRVKENRIRIKENEFDTLQERAANQEKAGQEVDSELLSKMKSIQLEINQFDLEIREVELRQEEARATFMLDRDRMVELWELIYKKDWVEPETPLDE
jgi:hypothetical protein